MVHRVKHFFFPGEFHLGLGGMDVHVHLRDRQRHVQHAAGEFSFHQLVAVALFQRRRQQLGLDKAAVDEEHLHTAGAAAHEGLGDEAPDLHFAAAAADRQQGTGEVPAQGGVDGRLHLSVAGGVEGFRAVLDEAEGDIGMGQGQMLHQSADGGRFGAVLLHEFQTGGRVVKEVPHGDGGAFRRARFFHDPGFAALDMQRGADARALPGGQNIDAADGGDGRQGLAAEAQSADAAQVFRLTQLAGGVAQKRGGQLRRGNAAAVVRHADHAHAAPPDLHHDGGGTGVDGVFHQFLHDAGRALHHFAGGDQICHVGRQLLNMRHPSDLLSFSIRSALPWRWPPCAGSGAPTACRCGRRPRPAPIRAPDTAPSAADRSRPG